MERRRVWKVQKIYVEKETGAEVEELMGNKGVEKSLDEEKG